MTQPFLSLLQLVSPTLPVGAYSYSEGLETLIDQEIIYNSATLATWLNQELRYGSIRIEAAIMLRSYHCFSQGNFEAIAAWNHWFSAVRETSELRQQSLQMGQSLLKLLAELEPELKERLANFNSPCNYAIAFGIGAKYWHIELAEAILGYLQSWTVNLISAAVRLIPLGQTTGQKILLNLSSILIEVTGDILTLKDEDLSSCTWGLSLASMAHETQYTRLFRS